MTTVRMCDNCKQIITDKQPVYLSVGMAGIAFSIDCHIDCLPDWIRSFHAEQIAKYKPQQPTQHYPPSTISF